jgi:hypothetical protein
MNSDPGTGGIEGSLGYALSPMENTTKKPPVGLEGRVEPSQVSIHDVLLNGAGIDSTESHSVSCLKDPNVLSNLDETIFNFIPFYRDILTRSPLPIFVGREPVPKKLENPGKGEIGKCDPDHTSMGEAALLKGAVRGGMDKYLSPLKTRTARKLGK